MRIFGCMGKFVEWDAFAQKMTGILLFNMSGLNTGFLEVAYSFVWLGFADKPPCWQTLFKQ
jgi:hypothetical protein